MDGVFYIKQQDNKLQKSPKLFIPGPTHVSETIMDVFSTKQIGHRTPEISDLISFIVKGIQNILYTKNHIYLASHAATGLWEMATKNSVKKSVLHAVNGAFSSKWALSSEQLEYDVKRIDFEWGHGIDVDKLDKELSTGKYDVFAMVHNETSTGAMSDLNAISSLLKTKYPDIIWLVDAVSSMAGVKIEVDKLGIDFILSSTQKAWGLPAGFSICAVSNRMIRRSLDIKGKGYFLDLQTYEKYYIKNQTPTTPSIPHMYGLKKVLELIDEEGLDNRWKRHNEMAGFTRNWAIEHGQKLFTHRDALSYTLTCIDNVQKWDIKKINENLLNQGFRMDRGYGKFRYKAFRIPHMGNIYMEDLKEYLNAFNELI
ncbi:MAG: aminotransferase [Candidatus Marinimicrobia bacterium]|nr:aminotransferase [Candidatus Neomarinimicrobiota bacterium]|tara:strand:- start:26010 stop:27119 length:1110 start_codon:yes stop_codon:yes gene_type:complete